jgi:hypothetical protein
LPGRQVALSRGFAVSRRQPAILKDCERKSIPRGVGNSATGQPQLRRLPQLFHFVEDLALRRETPLGLLGEDGLSVDADDEDPAASTDDLAVDRKLPFDFSRQTGGSR